MQDIINRLRAKQDDEGFTLIELLVVVVIIGVLVAIAVPVYLNYRQGAADKSAQSDVRGAISAIEQYYTENGNTYPAGFANQDESPIDVGDQQITLSDKTSMTFVPNGNTSYLICATNEGGSDKVYLYDSTSGGSVAEADVDMANCA
ncbi:MAG TPA: prepilin-type N-terminal cleavage/methylation domain-containing protein [Actinoplanes sp.]|nr:prepilin-type N-terminal cleavage/methylation domain-containing protein [Actinoplanes sp.]